MLIIKGNANEELELMKELSLRGYVVEYRENASYAHMIEMVSDIVDEQYGEMLDLDGKEKLIVAIMDRIKNTSYGTFYQETVEMISQVVEDIFEEGYQVSGWSQYTIIDNKEVPVCVIGSNEIYYINGFYKVVIEEVELCNRTAFNGPCFLKLEDAIGYAKEINPISICEDVSDEIDKKETQIVKEGDRKSFFKQIPVSDKYTFFYDEEVVLVEGIIDNEGLETCVVSYGEILDEGDQLVHVLIDQVGQEREIDALCEKSIIKSTTLRQAACGDFIKSNSLYYGTHKKSDIDYLKIENAHRLNELKEFYEFIVINQPIYDGKTKEFMGLSVAIEKWGKEDEKGSIGISIYIDELNQETLEVSENISRCEGLLNSDVFDCCNTISDLKKKVQSIMAQIISNQEIMGLFFEGLYSETTKQIHNTLKQGGVICEGL